jgi:putative peptidoglycan lipid II flippase
MFKNIFSVGLFTLLSRFFGFGRDLLLASVLGAGAIADAFFIAYRLPNHFRSIFAEGAFNSAFVPSYAKVVQEKGKNAALAFADIIFVWLLYFQIAFLILALVFTPQLVGLMAGGLDETRFPLAVELTRITFPYLGFMAIVVLLSAILNAQGKFAAAAASPIILNIVQIFALLSASLFVTAGHAAAYGVVVSGLLQFLLVGIAAIRAGVMVQFTRPRLSPEVRNFWRKFTPAILGSAGVQIALFADTIVASFLPQGAVSVLYYADRINQLPMGVIGIAVGTVLLADMSNKIAAGDEQGARNAQLRGMELVILFTLPFLVAFTMIPEIIMRALFLRGAFTLEAAIKSGETLAAYGLGLTAFMLMRSATVTFNARGDTKTPVKAMFFAVIVNVGLKFALVGPLAHVGLALATSIGAWLNFLLLMWYARQRGYFGFDALFKERIFKLALAGLVLAYSLIGADLLLFQHLRDSLRLIGLMSVGGLVYILALALLLGKQFLKDLKKMRRGK